MASPPPSTAGLTPGEKARLHNVADLVLQIYLTLARMRHVDPDTIQRGPHDLSDLYPLFDSLCLDPRVVYLYHILPYLDPRRAEHVGFVQGARLADFRREADVRCAREAFARLDDPGYVLRPWMTALDGFGERGQVMLYDARRDVVHLLGECAEGSWDRNLEEGQVFEKWSEEKGEMVWYEKPVDGREDVPLVEVVDIEAWRRAHGWYMDEDGEEGEQNEEGEQEEGGREGHNGEEEQEEEEDNEDKDKDDDEGEPEQENYWDEMEARPATRVLQDIVRWYHELVEIPGDCVDCIGEWSAEVVRPLYRRHGWPGEDFDGDAFVVDQARSKEPEYLFWEVWRLKQKMEKRVRQREIGAVQRQEKLAAAKTVDKEWAARWEVWIADKDTAWWKDRVRMAREWKVWGKAHEDAEGPPLRELAEVQRDLEVNKGRLKDLKQSLEAVDNPSSRQQIQLQILDAEKTTAIMRQAYEATRTDVERAGPGKPLYSLYTTDIEVKQEYLTRTIRGWEREVAEILDWAAQLPDGADEARVLALRCASEKESKIEKYKGRLDQEAVRLKKRTEGSDGPE